MSASIYDISLLDEKQRIMELEKLEKRISWNVGRSISKDRDLKTDGSDGCSTRLRTDRFAAMGLIRCEVSAFANTY